MNKAFASLFTLLLVAPNLAIGLSVSKVGDITVTNNNGIIRCDQIECPPGTARCHASKESNGGNLLKVTRENICYDANDLKLKEKSWGETGLSNRKVNVHVDIYADGRTSVSNSIEGDGVKAISGIAEGVSSIVNSVGNFFRGFNVFPFFK